MTFKHHLAIFGALSIIGFTLDRILKQIAITGVQRSYVHGGFEFGLVSNPYIAFSIRFPTWLSLAVSPVVILFFVWLMVRLIRSGSYARAGFCLVTVVGAWSNYLDRLQHGYVVDYVNVGPWLPVFNVGDLMIISSLVALLIMTVKKQRR